MSPTQRSLAKLKAEGWTVAIVERFNIYAKVRQDLFGFIDLVAMRPTGGIVGVQVTTGSNAAAHVEKIKNEPKAAIWLASCVKIVVHGWRKVGARGKRKLWECREIVVGG